MSQNLTKYFPWFADGPLCPVLNCPNVWIKAFNTKGRRFHAKRACKRCHYNRIISITDDEVFGKAMCWLLNEPMRRNVLAKELANANFSPFYAQVWRAFYIDDKSLQTVWRKEDCFIVDAEDAWFLDVPQFKLWLQKRCYNAEQARSIAIVACCFAVLQPKDAAAILDVLIQHDPKYIEWLQPVTSAIEPTTPASDNFFFPPQPNAVIPESRSCNELISITNLSHDPQQSKTSNDPLSLEEFSRGELLLSSFLQSHQELHALLKRLPARLENIPVAVKVDILCAEICHAISTAQQQANAAESWLSQFHNSLQTVGSDKLSLAEPAIETVRGRLSHSRETHDLLRNACEEVLKTVGLLKLGTESRAKRLNQMLEEIHQVDELLERQHFRPSLDLTERNLLVGLRLTPEIELQLQQTRAEKAAFLVKKKSDLNHSLDALLVNIDIGMLPPEIKNQIKDLRASILVVDSISNLASNELGISQLQKALASHPETRDFNELVDGAIGNLSTANILTLVKALNARRRSVEGLALLSCLQLVTEVEVSGLDDFSPFIDELLFTAAQLNDLEDPPFLWIDAIFQQPWLRAIARNNIRIHNSWERLVVAFIVQEHLRGTELEVDLFYRLDVPANWPRDRFPVLWRLLNSISTRHPIKIVPVVAPSALGDVENRLSKFFERNERGDYFLQAAEGDKFCEMEKHHLFPSLERVYNEVRQLCNIGKWDEAIRLIGVKPERLLADACRAMEMETTTSPFYRRKVLDPQNGYLFKFLRDLNHYIEVARKYKYSDHVDLPYSTLLGEIEKLAAQETRYAPFWTAVKKSISEPPIKTLRKFNSGEDIFAGLVHNFSSVAILAIDYAINTCQQFAPSIPSASTLSQMLKYLSHPPEDLGFDRFHSKGCLRHALLVVEQLKFESKSLNFQGNPSILESKLRHEIEQKEAKCEARWNTLFPTYISGISFEDYQLALSEGRFPYLDAILTEGEIRANKASAASRNDTDNWLQEQKKRLVKIKATAVSSGESERWLDSIINHAASVERILLRGERDFSNGRDISPNLKIIESALTALEFVTASKSQTFTEVEGYIQQIILPAESKNIKTPSPTAIISIPEIAKSWEILVSVSDSDSEQIGLHWQILARAFCEACRLHYELHQSLVFSGVKGYICGHYTTRFIDPRSSWLDREVNLYLAFGKTATAVELEALVSHLDKHTDCLNLVLVPSGCERLSKLWKYNLFKSNYLLIDDELLRKICARPESGATNRYDVPLRQELHQSAEQLTSIGLFKSEGFVHVRKNIFVGRALALQQLAQQPASAIWGGRRTGKTSLLQAFRERLRHPNLKGGPYSVALVYGDKATGDPDFGIALAIAKDLGLREPNTLEDFDALMQDACRNKRIAVLIDEMDRYIQLSRETHGPSAFPLARVLRGISQRDFAQGFKLVYAGFKQLYYEVRVRQGADPSDPFKNILQPVMKDFRDLELKEVEELLHIGFEDMLGVDMELSVPRLVTEKTSGHPAFVQRFCERLLARLSKRRQFESRLRLTAEDVNETYREQTPMGSPETAFIDYVNETLDWNMSPLERLILLVMSTEIRSTDAVVYKEYSVQQIADLLEYWCTQKTEVPDHHDVREALHMLTMTNMLTQSSEGQEIRFRITYPAYIDIMNRLEELGKVEISKSLADYHKTKIFQKI